MNRRGFLLAGAALPIACAPKPPETPLAHLYGESWVHGAYELYAGKYLAVQSSAEAESFASYRVLADRGVTALDALQTRGVPFYVRVTGDDGGFVVERTVPERLTLTADMDDAQRKAAHDAWAEAREHIQTDYEEVERLNGALTKLLRQIQRVRTAIDKGEHEEFRLVRQREALAAGGPPPFALPYQVAPNDYADVLALLLERLDDDRARLAALESDIVAVGLVARATDQGSGSLASNLHAVLGAVAVDATATSPRPAGYPTPDARERALARGKDLSIAIARSPAYQQWRKDEQQKQDEQIGQMLALLDSVTHLPVSRVYKLAMNVWRGDGDYLGYLRDVASLVPGGGKVGALLDKATTLTQRARSVADAAASGASVADVVAAAQKKSAGLLNVVTAKGKAELGKQLAFYENEAEAKAAKDALAASPLFQ